MGVFVFNGSACAGKKSKLDVILCFTFCQYCDNATYMIS
jgi:hypothetical protein